MSSQWKNLISVTPAPVVSRHRPAPVLIVVCVLVFLGVSAVAGGVALLLDIGAAPPADWLNQIPLIDSWIVPGLVLSIGFGLGSLVAAVGVLRKPRWPWLGVVERFTHHHWSWTATILIGLGHVTWIALELRYLPELSALQAVYGGVGIALVLLPILAPVRAYLCADELRHADLTSKRHLRSDAATLTAALRDAALVVIGMPADAQG